MASCAPCMCAMCAQMFIRKTLSFYTCANIFNLLAITNDFDYISMVDSLNVVNFMRKRSTQVRLHFFFGIFFMTVFVAAAVVDVVFFMLRSCNEASKKREESEQFIGYEIAIEIVFDILKFSVWLYQFFSIPCFFLLLLFLSFSSSKTVKYVSHSIARERALSIILIARMTSASMQ